MRLTWFPTRKTITTVLAAPQGGATGSATITLERVSGRICFKLAWAGIGSPVSAHIYRHDGGAAVLPLFVDTPKRKGCVKASKSLIRKIAESPGHYHVRVHTQCQPDGALRAQLES
jgi:hypothetical protein